MERKNWKFKILFQTGLFHILDGVRFFRNYRNGLRSSTNTFMGKLVNLVYTCNYLVNLILFCHILISIFPVVCSAPIAATALMFYIGEARVKCCQLVYAKDKSSK